MSIKSVQVIKERVHKIVAPSATDTVILYGAALQPRTDLPETFPNVFTYPESALFSRIKEFWALLPATKQVCRETSASGVWRWLATAAPQLFERASTVVSVPTSRWVGLNPGLLFEVLRLEAPLEVPASCNHVLHDVRIEAFGTENMFMPLPLGLKTFYRLDVDEAWEPMRDAGADLRVSSHLASLLGLLR